MVSAGIFQTAETTLPAWSRLGVLLQIHLEEIPDGLAGVHVALGPGVLAADDLVQADLDGGAAFPGRVAADEAVEDHRMGVLGLERQVLRHLIGAAGFGAPAGNGLRHADVGAPAALVCEIPVPKGGLVSGTVDLHQGDGGLGSQLLIGPFHRQAGDGRESVEHLGVAVGHQVGHLTAVGHAGQESVLRAEPAGIAEMLDQIDEDSDIVPLQPGLERIAHIPAVFALAVFEALGITHGKALFLSHFHHLGAILLGIAAIAVEHNHERRIRAGIFGEIKPVCVFFAFVSDSVLHAFGRLQRQGRDEPQEDQDLFHGKGY